MGVIPQPLSVRNNNPGNMRGAGGAFQQFASPEAGMDAMRHDLLLKIAGNSPVMQSKYGQGYQPTLRNLISTWAPPSENNTDNYINTVAAQTGLHPDQALTPEHVNALIPAMTRMEGGNAASQYYSQAGNTVTNITPLSNEMTASADLPAGYTLVDSPSSDLPEGYTLVDSPQAAAPQRSTGEDLARQVGLTARYGIEGLSAIPELAINAPIFMGNAISRGVSGQDASQAPYMHASNSLDTLGFPKPENSIERVVGDIARSLTGTGGAIKAAEGVSANTTKPLMRNIATTLAEKPAAQAAAAITGAGAGSITREAGGSQGSQLIASLLGSLAPSAATLAPRTMLGINNDVAANMRQNIDTFNSAGTSPSVGQASQGRIPQAVESFLSKLPGSAGVMQNRAEAQAQNIGQGVDNVANYLAKGANAETAGRAIERGIKGDFMPGARKAQTQLYDKLDSSIPPDSPIEITNTAGTLSKLTSPIPGAEATSKTSIMKNPMLDELFQGIVTDAQSGALPYKSIKELRTRIGAKLENVDLAPDVPRAQLKQLYGSLTKDMEEAAKKAGPKAYADFKRANGFTKALHERIDTLQTVLDRNGGPEKIFQAAISGTGEGATTLRAVMKSIPLDNQKMVSSAVLRRLGRATPGNQNDVGDVFSMNTYLTNWNKLSPQAKEVLFKGYGPGFQGQMDKIAKVTANVREGSKVFANPSGTAHAEQLIKTGGSVGTAVVSLLTGHPLIAGTVGGGMVSANIAARAMTNPNFVRWLAKNADKSSAALPLAITELNALSKKDKDLEDVAKSLGGQQ